MKREQAHWIAYVAIAAAIAGTVIIGIAAYVERKVAPVSDYVAQVHGAKAPQAAEIKQVAQEKQHEVKQLAGRSGASSPLSGAQILRCAGHRGRFQEACDL
jgi:hypothetical protein